jgi:ParB-like chromosome segregation protein Spo0J
MSNFDTEIVEIPIKDIHVGVTITNIRTMFDNNTIHELADAIYRDGLMSPLIVMTAENTEGATVTELVAGERRLRAIQHIQRNMDKDFMSSGVPCIQFEGTIHDAVFINASENIEREQIDEVDTSAWLFQRVEDGVTQTELAERLHKKLQWVNFRILFHQRACAEVKQALREGLISFTAAYELSKNLEAEDQRKFVQRARRLNEKISLAEAQNSNKPERTKKPSKKAREKMLLRADRLTDDKGSDIGRGVALAIRWVDGLISHDDMEAAISFEEEK